jgi:hypothetical protein
MERKPSGTESASFLAKFSIESFVIPLDTAARLKTPATNLYGTAKFECGMAKTGHGPFLAHRHGASNILVNRQAPVFVVFYQSGTNSAL